MAEAERIAHGDRDHHHVLAPSPAAGPAGMMLRLSARPRRRRCRGAGEARRFLPRFPRRHHPSLDACRSCTSSACSTISSSGRIRRCASLPARSATTRVTLADFSHLPTHCHFIALMPQWDFLDFLAEQAERYPSFHLKMQAEVTDLVMEDGPRRRVCSAETPDGPLDVRADLVVGADGRHSMCASGPGLKVEDLGAPMDVLWFRLSKRPERRRADARPHPGRRGLRHARPRRLLAMRLCHPQRRLRRASRQGARRLFARPSST